MSLFRPTVEKMTAYVPGEQPAAGARVTKLNTNENPYPPSPAVAAAIAKELEGGGARLRLYSDPLALELRRAASEVTGFPVESIVAGNGSDELLALLVRAVVDPGESIVYPSPTYVLYETLAEAGDARIETVPFGADYSLPRALLGTRAKLCFVTSPNSPSGTSHPTAAIRELAESAPGTLVVVDEAYADFADRNALELARSVPNVVVLRTFSKSYSLAGMRLGLLFGSPEVCAGVSKVKDSYNLDRLAIVAGAAALRDQAWMKENVRKIRETRGTLTRGLEALGLSVLPSSANFVLARLESPERAREAHRSLKERGVLTRYFDRPGLSDSLRITVGTDEEIALLLAELRTALRGA
ncbi:MAG TPA: histidinol-phosphate transaminase [Polyangiaceae bacterium]|nr:histidinol-phosphate transaminase [Polyangiaceae bacterium]